MNYNITIIRPKGFLHSSGFVEVADSLAWSLTSLGHEAGITHNWISTEPDTTNIVFGAELLAVATKLPNNTIIYNLEQPSHPNIEKVKQLAAGLRVWDYSLTNVKAWQKAGYNVKHVPVGYTPNLNRIPKGKQDIDVLFYGWLTPRRRAVMQQLQARNIKVHYTDKCYGGGRDNLISRSKVVLNIHHDGRDLFEVVRVSYLLANSKCVVSEYSKDDQDYTDIIGGISLVASDQIVDMCQTLVEHEYSREKFEKVGHAAIKLRDYTQTVKDALVEVSKAQVLYDFNCQSGDMKDFLPWIKDHAKGTCMEIGVRNGASTAAFLLGIEANGGVLLSIDKADCSQLFAGHPQWKFIQSDSQNDKLKVPELDVLLIDGDHTRKGYKADLYKYFQFVKPGGLILSHDIDTVPGQTLEDVPGSDYPSIAIREEYFKFAHKHKLKHSELPGKYGFGVMVK